MTEQEIKNEFKTISRNLMLIRIIGGILLLPLLIIFFAGSDSFIGISRSVANLLLIVGVGLNLVYLLNYWKCPACGKKIESGHSVKKCESCNALFK
ncbi:hypothetical protein JK628_02275 [Shewanella sp. KX20019]|uniref:hypothetical protein n=1 Tax=Shewanella sp. KX20019 TaxID=2803864 RepID=UPI00192862A9|nr:hypothetical protein [Shewanella sp. KX20019]QQX80720.1 hypothetical protein JK628_02275 [Shewanella sp. KX20019]